MLLYVAFPVIIVAATLNNAFIMPAIPLLNELLYVVPAVAAAVSVIARQALGLHHLLFKQESSRWKQWHALVWSGSHSSCSIQGHENSSSSSSCRSWVYDVDAARAWILAGSVYAIVAAGAVSFDPWLCRVSAGWVTSVEVLFAGCDGAAVCLVMFLLALARGSINKSDGTDGQQQQVVRWGLAHSANLVQKGKVE